MDYRFPRTGRFGSWAVALLGGAWLPLAAVAGCAAQDKAATPAATDYDRQEKAMKDPFHYSPDMGNTDISGGGIGDFDRAGMRKDLDNVLNP